MLCVLKVLLKTHLAVDKLVVIMIIVILGTQKQALAAI
jgi:hypothetical protein